MNNKQNSSIFSDIQGAGRLTIDAAHKITDIVEDMHHTITSIGGLLGAQNQQRTTGITRMAYQGAHTASRLVGNSFDALLDKFSLMIPEKESSPGREALLSALNGVLGDYLVKKENPLAIPMQLRRDSRPILMGAPTLFESIQQSNKKIVLMVHGSCMNDLQWNRQGHNHGTALENNFELFPIFLHYNTGRHISENGRELANLLEAFVKHLPWSIELIIIAHSMGGLVSRSACYYGDLAQHTWLNHLKKLIFLGTPHHGALLEKSGNWVDILLEANPYSAPFAKLGKLRSSGLTDLRYGNILDEDWKGSDRFKYSGDNRKATPLPDNVQCYTIAATAGKKPGRINDDLIGDGLVTLNSALGRNKNPDLNLLFPESHQWIGRNMNHIDLLNHPDVYKAIKKFAIILLET